MGRVFLTLTFLVLWATPALAGPGGIVRSPVVLWALIILAPILVPIAIYVYLKERKQVKKTEKDLARLASVYSQYQWLTLRDRAQDTFRWIWSEWSQGKFDESRQFATEWYWSNQQLLLDEWESKDLENVCDLHKIYSIQPLFVAHNSESENNKGSRVVVKINAEVWDFLRNKITQKIVKGEDKAGSLETLWTFLWDGERWLLDRIEEGTLSLEYAKIANIVPEVLNAPTSAYNPGK